jgi:uncharacterized surface protein with fasciclin (FAS1) repeats
MKKFYLILKYILVCLITLIVWNSWNIKNKYEDEVLEFESKIKELLLKGGMSVLQIESEMQKELTKNIVENAINSKDHTTLVAAVKAAGLVETLQSTGPFTVFAPTNDAFVSFLEERVDFNTLADIPQSILTQTLQYHVVSGNVRSSQLTQNQEVLTLQGSEFTVDLVGGAKLTDTEGRVSNVIAVDVQANNGVVHVLDKVILPAFN